MEAETEQRSCRRARQSIREYELIWLLRQLLLAVSWPHWRLRCMQPLHGHGKSHGQGWVGDLHTTILAGCRAGAPRRKFWGYDSVEIIFVTMLMGRV